MSGLVLRIHSRISDLDSGNRVSSGPRPVDHVPLVGIRGLINEFQPLVDEGVLIIVQFSLDLSVLLGEILQGFLGLFCRKSLFILQARSATPLPSVSADVRFNPFCVDSVCSTRSPLGRFG